MVEDNPHRFCSSDARESLTLYTSRGVTLEAMEGVIQLALMVQLNRLVKKRKNPVSERVKIGPYVMVLRPIAVFRE